MFVRDQRAFASGAFLSIGALFFLILSFRYAAGSAASMGPGYFPRVLSVVLGFIGISVMFGATRPAAEAVGFERWDFIGLAWILGSVWLFAFLLRPVGFIGALLVLIILSSKASAEFNLRGALVTAAILIVMCVAVFVYGLALSLPLWPEGWN